MKYRIISTVFALLALITWNAGAQIRENPLKAKRTPTENIIVDSDITLREALRGSIAPWEIIDSLCLVDVYYLGIDSLMHRGQIVVNEAVRNDVETIFDFMLKQHYRICTVVPIRFDLPAEAPRIAPENDTYSFHYRAITSGGKLSRHSFGRAIDINPQQNPYISRSGKTVIPENGVYAPKTDPLALTAYSPIVDLFISLGWVWGGNWKSPKDYMHFEKRSGGRTFIPVIKDPQPQIPCAIFPMSIDR